MWQKARICRDGLRAYHQEHLAGREVWIDAKEIRPIGQWHVVKSNLVASPISPANHMGLALEVLELLPEFAEDVPLISWQDFIEGNSK